MSALPPKADIGERNWDVRFVPLAEIDLFDDLPNLYRVRHQGHNYRMTYVVPEIVLATRDDVIGILDLQEQNLLGRGGLLSVRLPDAFIEAALEDLPQIVARRDGKIVAYLLAGSRGLHAQTPIIQAMFRAYPGSHDAYVYGPICVAESERGHGLATALFAELRGRLPGRECIAFVRRDNAASLQAHLKMGMKDVASFEHDGVAHAVLALVPHRA
jgi:predicted GNAT superfamily acetyltransferase